MNHYRKQLFLTAVAGAIIMTQPQLSHADQTDHRLIIGISTALSGVATDFGTSIANGFILAKEDAPDAFSGITFSFQDDRYDPKTAISNFHRFRAQGAHVVYVAGVAPSEAVAPLAEQYAFPTLLNCQDSRVGRSKYSIRTINPSEQYSQQLLEHLRQRGFRHLAIVATSASYNDALLNGLKAHLRADERLDLINSFTVQDNDFRSSISRIKQGNYDALGVYLFPGQLSSFFRQAGQQNLNLPIFGTDVFESRDEIEQARGGMDGAVFAFNTVDEGFAKRYRLRFGNDSQLASAANAYDIANMLADILGKNRGGLPSGEALLDQIKTIEQRAGVSGSFSFRNSVDHGQYLEFPISIKRIKNSEIEVLERR